MNQVAMVPSAVPAYMAVEGGSEHASLSSSTHAPQLRISSSGPIWREITEAQRQVLMPLRDRWDSMGALTKRRWLVLADRYPKMDESERNKLVSRMNTWASLSAQQRNQARINFESAKRLSAKELQEKWDEYQALSEAERKRLAEQARKAKAAKKSKAQARRTGTQSRSPRKRRARPLLLLQQWLKHFLWKRPKQHQQCICLRCSLRLPHPASPFPFRSPCRVLIYLHFLQRHSTKLPAKSTHVRGTLCTRRHNQPPPPALWHLAYFTRWHATVYLSSPHLCLPQACAAGWPAGFMKVCCYLAWCLWAGLS